MTNKKSNLQANANSIFSANLGKVRFFSIERTKTTLFSYPMTCCVSLASTLTHGKDETNPLINFNY